jgi:hypothetical protein
MIESGMVHFIREQSGIAYLTQEILVSYERAMAPFPPRNPYRICPCHRAPMGMPTLETPPGLAWVAKEYGPA